jgi:hypothetical protein
MRGRTFENVHPVAAVGVCSARVVGSKVDVPAAVERVDLGGPDVA